MEDHGVSKPTCINCLTTFDPGVLKTYKGTEQQETITFTRHYECKVNSVLAPILLGQVFCPKTDNMNDLLNYVHVLVCGYEI